MCGCGSSPCSCGKAMDDDTLPTPPTMDEPQQEAPPEAPPVEPPVMEQQQSLPDDSMQPHEKKTVMGASGFLGELKTEMNFGDDHRKKSYHYHKTLAGIMEIDDMMTDQKNMDGGTPQKSWYKAVGEASGFLGELSNTRDFGDAHRHKAGACCQALQKALIAPESKSEMMNDVGGAGSMGEVAPADGGLGTKALKDELAKREQSIENLTRKLNSLMW
jgi:hypothetical protein